MACLSAPGAAGKDNREGRVTGIAKWKQTDDVLAHQNPRDQQNNFKSLMCVQTLLQREGRDRQHRHHHKQQPQKSLNPKIFQTEWKS
jgi:hypothetical protein